MLQMNQVPFVVLLSCVPAHSHLAGQSKKDHYVHQNHMNAFFYIVSSFIQYPICLLCEEYPRKIPSSLGIKFFQVIFTIIMNIAFAAKCPKVRDIWFSAS